jgi:hypothetical protein
MAINNSNSNFVNINSLPQSQEALDTDLLILQTDNGTQTITFQNFNVLKTKANGDAVLPGTLSGNTCNFNSVSSLEVVSDVYRTNRAAGDSVGPQYCNYFTVDNGIVTNASYLSGTSPDYSDIVFNKLPALSAYQNTIYKRIAEQAGSITFGASTEFTTITISNFFIGYPLVIGNIKPYHLTLMLNQSAAVVPYVSNIIRPLNTNDLSFEIHLGTTTPLVAPVQGFPTVNWRLLVTY